MRQLQLKGHISTLGAVILFGLMSPMCKLAMQSGVIDGLLLAFFRVSGAALLFWLISPLVKREKIARKDWLPLLGMSLCGMVISQFLYVLGIQYTSPTNACVVGTTTPVMTFILASIFLQHRVTWLRISGFLLASIGALVLILGSGGGLSGNPLGDMLCFVSQFSAACYFVFFGEVLRRYHPVTVMKWLFFDCNRAYPAAYVQQAGRSAQHHFQPERAFSHCLCRDGWFIPELFAADCRSTSSGATHGGRL